MYIALYFVNESEDRAGSPNLHALYFFPLILLIFFCLLLIHSSCTSRGLVTLYTLHICLAFMHDNSSTFLHWTEHYTINSNLHICLKSLMVYVLPKVVRSFLRIVYMRKTHRHADTYTHSRSCHYVLQNYLYVWLDVKISR